ncbi:glycine zipper 2TM domain-containing protein, partial [Escherichia coli]|uniref:glycine zipper 2TM domain-containing protein n=8 Tax=Enterobacteriaceae TaxID=543 RepID=UPI000AD21677
AFAVTHHAFSSGAGRTSDGNGSHASTLKSPSYTKSVSWQHYQTVNIISILPAKVAVDNSQNKRNAQAFGALIGAVAGGVIGHNVGSGSNSGTTAGAVGGGAVGAAAGSMVNDKTLVEGVSLTYKEGTKVYTSTQVGKECQFTTGLAVVITTTYNETRIQPNTKCPEKS